MFLLGQDIIRKKRVDEKIVKQPKFKVDSYNKMYKVKSICNYAIYSKQSKIGHLLGLYYLVLKKSYYKVENILKYASAV